VALSQGILGVKPDYEGLRLDPCVATSWKGFRATRRFRGATYDIEVRNPRGVSTGVKRVLIDGAEAGTAKDPSGRGVVLPLFPAGSAHRIEVELGG